MPRPTAKHERKHVETDKLDDDLHPEGENTTEEMNEDAFVPPPSKKKLPHAHPSDKDAEGCHCYDSTFPKGKLPPPPILKKLDVEEEPKPKHGKDGIDKAMEIIDEYYEGTPLRNPNVDHGGED
jgi:hypothetical protein